MGACELADLSSWTTDTATDIKDLPVRLDTHVCSQVMLVAGYSLLERFTRVESAKVEGGAPCVLLG